MFVIKFESADPPVQMFPLPSSGKNCGSSKRGELTAYKCHNTMLIYLQIWDTAGQERFRSITQSYYRSAHALILVYDISSQPTFDCLPDWLREIEQYASCKVLRVLVGNKTDREDRELPTHVGEEFANRHNMYFIETSAKEADNVEKLFIEIAKELTQIINLYFE
ncbi:Ras-related protein Rab-30 [Armadillidium vulgare]|nr:Ras-related protein Rab-30 [Armadillidium vulgare]